MENQIQIFVVTSLIVLGFFVLATVYLVVKLKLNDVLLKKSETDLKKLNDSLQDIVTERTEKLRQSERLYRSLYEITQEVLENSPAGIIRLDRNLVIELENPEMVKIMMNVTGIKEDHTKKMISDIQGFETEQMSSFFDELTRGSEVSTQITFDTFNRDQLFCNIVGVPLFSDTHFDGAVVLLTNMTEQIRAEQQLKKSYDILKNSTEKIIQAMARTSEMRDPYTAGHQKRVQELALAIGHYMHITSEQMEGVKFAGIIHDIGKIAVPSDILSKPGKINPMEFEVIKNHSQVGYELLSEISFPWPIAEIVYQHHERVDGSGYPNKLTGENILLEAKILAVADTVEAMTSHRPYRPALGIELALKEISEHKGTYFEPIVVDACMALFSESKFTFTQE
ncbi:MAG: HD-GYP domain-containing protein [Candidatus Cloacimonetes bacterium]|nr:HD-GYP domain-containing protein [Candidatus Cloacimonadota bacterium]